MAAGDAVIVGVNDFTEQKERMRWVRGRGWRKVRSWQGPLDTTKIDTLVTQIQAANGEEIEVSKEHPTVITALVPSDANDVGVGLSDADAVTEWDLQPFDMDSALGTHGKFNASGVSPPALARIDKDLRSGVAYNVDYETIYAGLGEFNEYTKLRGQGTDTYLLFGFTLRKVITCERDNVYIREYQQVSTNHGKIITWDQIGVPAAALIEQPWLHMYVSSIWTNLNLKSGSAGGWADVYFDEWMVKPPGLGFVKEGKVRKRQIAQEYIGAIAWSATLYDGGKGTP